MNLNGGEMIELSESSLAILDCMLNAGSISDLDSILETLTAVTQRRNEDVQKAWDELIQKQIIIKKDYQWVVNPLNEKEVKEQLERALSNRNVTPECSKILFEDFVKNNPVSLALLIKLVGKVTKWAQDIYISLGEYDMNGIRYLCERLVSERIMFKTIAISRKHYYRSFHFRKYPFDVYEIIRNTVLKYLDVRDLRDEEWTILSLLLLTRHSGQEYEILKVNVDLTEPELRELLANLEERGLVQQSFSQVSLVETLKDPLSQYFKENVYRKVRSDITDRMKQRISRSLSNLSILISAKNVYELPGGVTALEPFPHKIVAKREMSMYENSLPDMMNAGLIFDLGEQVVIFTEILKNLENWLKSSIRESIVIIPARDAFLTSRVLQEIFSECKEYIKIQDPYIGEETFHILDYIPDNIKISLLTGIEIARNEEPEEIFRCIRRFKNKRKACFQVFFVGGPDGTAPFHDRFIISEDKCWQVGTSLKQIGRGKDTTILPISRNEKDEKIEPIFDRWWYAKKKELEGNELTRMNYEQWEKWIVDKEV
jgi:hypothetical protein